MVKEKHHFWRKHLEAQKESGLQVSKYCEVHSLKKNQFRYYRRQLKIQATTSTEIPPKLIPIRVVKQEKVKIEIEGVAIAFDNNLAASWLADLIMEVKARHARS